MPSTVIICPYCNAKLKLPAGSGHADSTSTRVKCRVCKTRFHPNIVIGPTAGPSILPPVAAATPPAPPPPVEAGVAAYPRGKSRATPAPAAPAPPESGAAAAAEVPAPEDQPAEEPHPPSRPSPSRRHHKRQSLAGQLPHMKPYEMALALALLLGVAGGLGAIVWRMSHADQPAPAPAAEATSARKAAPDESPPPGTFVTKPLPWQLLGVWKLCADDGREGSIEFRENGTMRADISLSGDALPKVEGTWELVREEDGMMVIEVSPDNSGLGGFRMALQLTSPDAFTLTKSMRGGISQWEVQRFVRVAGPAAPGGP
jgi:hypothetical protein